MSRRVITVVQLDGSRIDLVLSSPYRNKHTGERLTLLRVEPSTGTEVNALFCTAHGAEVWKDVSWNFHKDYEELPLHRRACATLGAPYGTSPPVKGDPYKVVGEEIHRRAAAWVAAAPDGEERTRRKALALGRMYSSGNWGDVKQEIAMLERRRLEIAVQQVLGLNGRPLPLTTLVGRARARAFGPVTPWKGFDRISEQRTQIEQAVARLTAEGDVICTPFRQYHLYDLAVRPAKAPR